MEFACFLKEILFTFIKDIDFQLSFPMEYLSVIKIFGAPENRGEISISYALEEHVKDPVRLCPVFDRVLGNPSSAVISLLGVLIMNSSSLFVMGLLRFSICTLVR